MPRQAVDPVVRFDRLTRRSDDRVNGCWEFQGAKVGPKGHRKFSLRTGATVLAHRFAFEQVYGDTGGLCVLHRCDNPACVRPTHLFLGTRADNNADMDRKGRRKPHVGEKNPLAKLTVAKVRQIRAEYAGGGTSYPKLAKRYGVGTSTIQQIVERKTWKTA